MRVTAFNPDENGLVSKLTLIKVMLQNGLAYSSFFAVIQDNLVVYLTSLVSKITGLVYKQTDRLVGHQEHTLCPSGLSVFF